MGEVLAVLSGKGGTGKTSVCAGVATALAASGSRVLCIDCDVGLRNLDISLGLEDHPSLSFLEVCRGSYPISQATAHPLYPSLRFLTAPMNCPAEKIDVEAFGNMLEQARRHFNYVFLDAPAGVDAGFRLVSSAADRFLLVTGAGPAAVRDAIFRHAALLLEQGLAQEDFLRMKRSALGRRIRSLDSFDSVCFRMCAYHFSGFDYFRFPEVYRSIEAREIQDLLRRVVQPERCSLSIINPLS